MFDSHSLLKRLKKIEKQLEVGTYIFRFNDNTSIEVTDILFRQIWDDIHDKHHNSTYEALKEKLNQGFPDDAGLIYLMMAEDPNENKDLWNEE